MSDGRTVTVVFRPGLAGERELAIGITDGRGRVRWTPESGGHTVVHAGAETRDVVVRHAATPLRTLVPLLLLILASLGAMVLGLRSTATVRR